ncbi:helix-turn-helix domain-containing protein, partial [Sinorhizobium meliloti]
VVILVVSNVAKRQPHKNNLNSSMKQGGSARRDTMERRFIKERQREGIARAKAARTYKGGKPRLDHNLIHKLHIEGLGASAIAKQAGCSRMQVYRVLAKTVAIAT